MIKIVIALVLPCFARVVLELAIPNLVQVAARRNTLMAMLATVRILTRVHRMNVSVEYAAVHILKEQDAHATLTAIMACIAMVGTNMVIAVMMVLAGGGYLMDNSVIEAGMNLVGPDIVDVVIAHKQGQINRH